MSKPVKLTNGEYNALHFIWNYSPHIGTPRGHKDITLLNLHAKGLLEHEYSEGGHERWWLSDAGKRALDTHKVQP